MARRVVWLALILSVPGFRSASAMQALADPSAQGPVGFAPIRSLDLINGSPKIPGSAPASGPSPGISPTNPTASGPNAALPETPVGGDPVSLSPIPPIGKSLERGYRFGRVSELFRKDRTTTPTPPVAGKAAAKVTTNTWSPDSAVRQAVHPIPVRAPAVAAPKGRPAPYADRIPESGRRQLDPKVAPADPSDPPAPEARPNPLGTEQPRRARPRMETDAAPADGRPGTSSVAEYRPQGMRPRMGETVATAEALAATSTQPSPGEAPTLDMVPPPLEPETPPRPESPVVIPAPAPEIVPIANPTPPAEPAPEPPPIVEAAAIAAPPMPAAEPSTPSEPAPFPIAARAPQAGRVPTQATRADPAVTRTSAERTTSAMNIPMSKDGQFATLRAAAVGDEVITIYELMVAVNERIHDYIDPTRQPTEEELKAIKTQIAPHVLKSLIDQSMILQEAKRVMKNEKNIKAFQEHLDKMWKDEELPGLLRQYKVSTEFELKAKLAEQGRIYDGLKDAYRKRMMSQEFVFKEMKNKATADNIELRAYYNEHQHDFDRPARMSWREIEIDQAKHADQDSARRQADALHERLAKGEDFGAVAMSSSEGPTAAQGGLYADITPGGYGIAPVNEALGKLAIGQLSPVIEAPGSFHIVRVESRREAGPLHFDEVQKEILVAVRNRNFENAIQEYLAKLRSRTLVRTMYDAPEPSNAKLKANVKP